jgi:hypothetical protein
MSLMTPFFNGPETGLLDLDAWEAPFRLSEEDVYHELGADQRHLGQAVEDREDGR